jgi:hypothetical protein
MGMVGGEGLSIHSAKSLIFQGQMTCPAPLCLPVLSLGLNPKFELQEPVDIGR